MPYCQNCGAEVSQEATFCNKCGHEIETGTQTTTTEAANEQSTTEGADYTHPGEDGFAWKHAMIVGLIGLIPAIILGIISPGDFGAIGILVGIPLFAYLGYQRPTIKTAFGRLSFWSAIMLFISPIMMILHTAIFIESETEGAAEEAGAAIGGTVLVLLAFVVGLPVGIAFYLLSRRYDIGE